MTSRNSLTTALLAGLAGAAEIGGGGATIPYWDSYAGPRYESPNRGPSGKAPYKHAAKRRAKNKAARKSRKANRGK